MIRKLGPRRIAGLAAGAGALLVTACTGSSSPVPGVPNAPGAAAAAAVRLVSFDTCEQALNDLKAAAEPHVTAYGMGPSGEVFAADLEMDGGEALAGAPPVPDAAGDGGVPDVAGDGGVPDVAGDAGAPAAGAVGERAADGSAPEHSGTNVHEDGVDEPDLVKTDGRRLVTLQHGNLRVVDLERRELTGTLELQGAHEQMLLSGDRLLVVGLSPFRPMDGAARPMDGAARPMDGAARMTLPAGEAELVLIDLADEPTVVERLRLDGMYTDARLVGSTARVVLRSTPRLPMVYPDHERSEDDAMDENLRVLRESAIDDWVPHFVHEADGVERSGALVGCTDISHPEDYSGTGMLSIVSVDLDRGLQPSDTVSVLGDGQTVYATGESLYIAHGGRWWLPDGGGTEVHKFGIGGSGRPEYRASGAVEGWLLNQYAMSEHEGHLRIATTTENPARRPLGGEAPAEGPDSESQVVVLADRDGVLAEVGRVGGLGKGERIYAVRFLGPVGFVVTFRQIDPLYTVDLSDPADPRVLGELKIPGYSAYLHPVGDGRLVGVGQDATEEGVPTGTQVSLFDVSDLTDPRRIDTVGLDGALSEVEHDPHAFLYWPRDDLVVVPVQGLGPPVPLPEPEEGLMEDPAELWVPPSGEALVLRLEGDSLTEVGRLGHPVAADPYEPWIDASVRRSLVVGDELWTVSSAGVMANDVRDLSEQAWIPFD